MANIRVDLDYTIVDGAELVFKSPCHCSEATGLIVYYPNEINVVVSQEFIFADAHKNDVTDLDDLFGEEAIVKVILDIVHSRAYVQNADTNKYLEDRFEEIENSMTTVSIYTATIPTTGWSLTTPHTIEIKVDGIVESDNPIISVVQDKNEEIAKSQLEAWGCINEIETGNGVITCTCYNGTPNTEIPILIKEIRGYNSGGSTGGGGSDNYEALRNKPKVNGVELIGDKSFEELQLQEMALTDTEIDEILI